MTNHRSDDYYNELADMIYQKIYERYRQEIAQPLIEQLRRELQTTHDQDAGNTGQGPEAFIDERTAP